jgi:uncharacterized protein
MAGRPTGEIVVDVHTDLRPLLWLRHRLTVPRIPPDPAATLGHVVETLGVPLTEVGALTVDRAPRRTSDRADTPGTLAVLPLPRPQQAPTDPPAFVLDVHLGSLARRLRFLGLDTAWAAHAEDADLVALANAERRVLLTRDRGILRRRALAAGAYVRGERVDEQADDVLDRFAPPLAPWTRCPACGAPLEPVDAAEVAASLEPGTRSTYAAFARCTACGRPYWRGAHARRLDDAVRRAEAVVSRRRARPNGVTPGSSSQP